MDIITHAFVEFLFLFLKDHIVLFSISVLYGPFSSKSRDCFIKSSPNQSLEVQTIK